MCSKVNDVYSECLSTERACLIIGGFIVVSKKKSKDRSKFKLLIVSLILLSLIFVLVLVIFYQSSIPTEGERIKIEYFEVVKEIYHGDDFSSSIIIEENIMKIDLVVYTSHPCFEFNVIAKKQENNVNIYVKQKKSGNFFQRVGCFTTPVNNHLLGGINLDEEDISSVNVYRYQASDDNFFFKEYSLVEEYTLSLEDSE